MFHNENSSGDSNSSNWDAFDEWEDRVAEQNRQVDHLICQIFINTPNMIIGDNPRARRKYRDREHEQGETRLMKDYFLDNPTYDKDIFRCRFRMRKPLFLRIVAAVTASDTYFQQRRDATGRKGLSSLQKCTGAMRVLAYGTSIDAQDEYLRMSDTVTRDALIKFVEDVISCFSQEYLRRPNEDNLRRLLHVGAERGFPGRSGKPTIILEAVASYDLWIWHAFFGTPGRTPNVSYVINGRDYNRAYYLTDDIYPPWAAFVKSITYSQLRKHKLFARHQEAARKDVERAFGVLQARFAFLRHPCHVWDNDMMGKIMIACIIMHNMVVEDERDTYLNYYDPFEFQNDRPRNQRRRKSSEDDEQHFQYSTQRIGSLASYMVNREQLRNREANIALKNDLIEHI